MRSHFVLWGTLIILVTLGSACMSDKSAEEAMNHQTSRLSLLSDEEKLASLSLLPDPAQCQPGAPEAASDQCATLIEDLKPYSGLTTEELESLARTVDSAGDWENIDKMSLIYRLAFKVEDILEGRLYMSRLVEIGGPTDWLWPLRQNNGKFELMGPGMGFVSGIPTRSQEELSAVRMRTTRR